MKHQESSKWQQENISNNKCRKSAIRSASTYQVKIKISCLTSLKIVKIERYKDSPDHTHDLRESDRVKRSQAVWTLVEKEAVKNYSPPAITAAVKEYAADELGLGSSVYDLNQKEVTNIKYKIRGPIESHLIGNNNLKKIL